MELTGLQILVKALEAEGVDTLFMYSGTSAGRIRDAMDQSGIRRIPCRHEQGAVHAADGYARAGEKPGVCLIAAGSNPTSAVTGITAASLDHIPMVVLIEQESGRPDGFDGFQEVDILGIALSCAKHAYQVVRAEEIGPVVREAFSVAVSGRPGPVLIDISPEAGLQKADFVSKPEPATVPREIPGPDPDALAKAVSLINTASHPILFAGGGVISSRAVEALREFARKTRIPVTASLMGIGVFPASDPLWLGMTGIQGISRAQAAAGSCDLLIAVGLCGDTRTIGKTDVFTSSAKIIHIDEDPDALMHEIPIALPVAGDCRLTLESLTAMMAAGDAEKRTKWLDYLNQWKIKPPPPFFPEPVIHPRQALEALFASTKGEALICAGSRRNQMWIAQYYPFDAPHLFTPIGLGCPGFGLPAAVGAKIARPDRIVAVVEDAAGFQVNLQELATAVELGLPLKIILLNSERKTPDLLKLAEAYGVSAIRAEKPDQIERALQQALVVKGKPVVVEFVITP